MTSAAGRRWWASARPRVAGPRCAAAAVGVLLIAPGSLAHAGGIASGGAARREAIAAVWDGTVETLYVAASGRSRGSEALNEAYVFSLDRPLEAGGGRPVSVRDAFAALYPSLPPALAGTSSPVRSLTDEGVSRACGRPDGFACAPAIREWFGLEAARGRFVDALVTAPAAADVVVGYATFRLHTAKAVLPFAEPPASYDDDAAGVDVDVSVDLGLETGDGRWERHMDDLIASTHDQALACVRAASRPVAGDMHVAFRFAAGAGRPDVVGPGASARELEPAAACYAKVLGALTWPAPPAGRPAPFEVNAVARRASAAKVVTYHLLLPRDAEPHLGSADDPRRPPEVDVVASFELSAAQRTSAVAAGLLEPDSPSRWRLIVMSGHGAGDDEDLVMRPLEDLPPVAQGETPAPIIEPGDRPFPRGLARRRRPGRSRAAALLLCGVAVFLTASACCLEHTRRRL